MQWLFWVGKGTCPESYSYSYVVESGRAPCACATIMARLAALRRVECYAGYAQEQFAFAAVVNMRRAGGYSLVILEGQEGIPL